MIEKTIIDYIAKRPPGTKVDFDGAYGAQCVDLFRDYCGFLGLAHQGAVEGAKDIWLKDRCAAFAKKAADCALPGDVVVFDASESNIYGHVALVVTRTKDGTELLCYEQDGFKKNGTQFKMWPVNKRVLGILRYDKSA